MRGGGSRYGAAYEGATIGNHTLIVAGTEIGGRSLGYSTAVLGGSGDQGVDIIAIAKESKVAVQCKNYKKPVGNKPVQEVFAGSKHHHCKQAWVVAPAGYTKGAEELAQSVGVALFDVDSIRQWIKMIDEAEKQAMEQRQSA